MIRVEYLSLENRDARCQALDKSMMYQLNVFSRFGQTQSNGG